MEYHDPTLKNVGQIGNLSKCTLVLEKRTQKSVEKKKLDLKHFFFYTLQFQLVVTVFSKFHTLTLMLASQTTNLHVDTIFFHLAQLCLMIDKQKHPDSIRLLHSFHVYFSLSLGTCRCQNQIKQNNLYQ